MATESIPATMTVRQLFDKALEDIEDEQAKGGRQWLSGALSVFQGAVDKFFDDNPAVADKQVAGIVREAITDAFAGFKKEFPTYALEIGLVESLLDSWLKQRGY